MRLGSWLIITVVLVVLAVVGTYMFVTRTTAATVDAAPPVGSIRDVMRGMIDPASDVLFDAVATVSTAAGVIDRAPSTDEEWTNVEHNALMLAEAAALLRMPGRLAARPEEKEPEGVPNSPQLTALEVQQKIAADSARWRSHVDALERAGVQALTAARKRDKDGIFEVSEVIDTACEQCHLEYWYPSQKPGAPQ